ncbi:olfactory receptor 1044-like [Rana temporaria]|uniref:olfactory receptor 1044-like n=1 Tax=Rana temporaria TaxID=8407 RepID=UPI001AAD8785|nr:olfactory receptor 1044-like [Rana temporaria]
MNLEDIFNGTGFSIRGLSDIPEVRLPVFLILLLVYFSIIFGNLSIFTIILVNPNLHTPMYIFLMNLSAADIIYASNILPNVLNMLVTFYNVISFARCMTQMYFYIALTCTQVLLLEVMAYDRYLAICHPLRYFLLMSLGKCASLATLAWTFSFVITIGHIVLISKLSFCGLRFIDHFYCDIAAILKLTCSSTFDVEIMNYIEGVLITFNAFLFTIISYMFIISTILKIKTSKGQRKAFSTCSSHLTCVIIFYGTLFCLYMRPTSSYSPARDKFFALLSGVIIPILNPIIYSLKNQEIKVGLKNLRRKIMY